MLKANNYYNLLLICNDVVTSTQQFDAILAPLINVEIEFFSRRDTI